MQREVQDHSTGIPPEYLSLISVRLMCADNARTARISDDRLGLSISRGMIKQQREVL
jgi:signal transduction histidine kinase